MAEAMEYLLMAASLARTPISCSFSRFFKDFNDFGVKLIDISRLGTPTYIFFRDHLRELGALVRQRKYWFSAAKML
jgi:hypothetical protein